MAFKPKALAAICAPLILSACASTEQQVSKEIVTPTAVVDQYIDLAQAMYGDSLKSAHSLQLAVDALLEAPNAETLKAAKEAWISARAPYQQTEVYRFGNAIVDDWEGKVNAWPLDEGMIDYVASDYGSESDENPLYAANIIANPTLTIGGTKIDASTITPELLAETLHEADEVEANVATGYHVIEFLLWGQDLNGTNPGAGNRPASDFSLEACTNGNCDRRRAYLKAATDLLISDLKDIVAAWDDKGVATANLKQIGEQGALATMLTGMGSLAYGELAGERIKLGLMLHDPEEEHDCFSDNTHWSHFYDAKGIQNVYLGSYESDYGNTTSGASLSQLVAQVSPELNAEMTQALDNTQAAMQVMVDQAAQGNSFDVLIGQGNDAGNKVIQNIVDALVAQTKVTEQIIQALSLENIELEGSDSLDNPSSVL